MKIKIGRHNLYINSRLSDLIGEVEEGEQLAKVLRRRLERLSDAEALLKLILNAKQEEI